MGSGPIDGRLRASEAVEDRVGALVTESRAGRIDLKQRLIPFSTAQMREGHGAGDGGVASVSGEDGG